VTKSTTEGHAKAPKYGAG